MNSFIDSLETSSESAIFLRSKITQIWYVSWLNKEIYLLIKRVYNLSQSCKEDIEDFLGQWQVLWYGISFWWQGSGTHWYSFHKICTFLIDGFCWWWVHLWWSCQVCILRTIWPICAIARWSSFYRTLWQSKTWWSHKCWCKNFLVPCNVDIP